ncbi:hypothetical protein FQA39_LY12942 [Lamprigera yunnana]|nr:hypothetical protein FQA39_LY12942 [Lamprigera yunnana]
MQKGILKKKKKTVNLMVGDIVVIEVIDQDQKQGNIIDIEPRKNELYRPKIANVDQVIIITSLYNPIFASFILNKYIMKIDINKIKPILVFTKYDLLKASKDDEGKTKALESLKELVANKISVFAGQTGAGKSSTLNNFMDVDKQIRTNEISFALNRGKHTTTSIELYQLENKALIADTPGFSSFIEFINKCKYMNCAHISENDCAVKEAIASKTFPEFIYDDYVKVSKELEKTKKEKY